MSTAVGRYLSTCETLLQHSPPKFEASVVGRGSSCENTPYIFWSIYMQITREKNLGSLFVRYCHNQCNNEIGLATKWLSKTNFTTKSFPAFSFVLLRITNVQSCVKTYYSVFASNSKWFKLIFDTAAIKQNLFVSFNDFNMFLISGIQNKTRVTNNAISPSLRKSSFTILTHLSCLWIKFFMPSIPNSKK